MRPLTMSDPKPIMSDDARKRWREIVDDVEHNKAHCEIRRYTRRSAMLVPADWYDRARARLGDPPTDNGSPR